MTEHIIPQYTESFDALASGAKTCVLYTTKNPDVKIDVGDALKLVDAGDPYELGKEHPERVLLRKVTHVTEATVPGTDQKERLIVASVQEVRKLSLRGRREPGPTQRADVRTRVESLHGIIESNRFERPPGMIFVLTIPREFIEVLDGVKDLKEGEVPPEIRMNLESYVRMADLPKELSDQVRAHVRSMSIDWSKEMHPDTWAELEWKRRLDKMPPASHSLGTMRLHPDNPLSEGKKALCPTCPVAGQCHVPARLKKWTESQQKFDGGEVIVYSCDGIPRGPEWDAKDDEKPKEG